MKILMFLLQKEFKQIFRNRTILGIILVMPVMQLLVLPQAANYEVRNISLSIVEMTIRKPRVGSFKRSHLRATSNWMAMSGPIRTRISV